MNRLCDASSPYLRQHADNPVDWYEWGDEAFARARAEDKPVFLSVGYASCHWCHVMAHESFEDPEVARVLNAGFVAVKVDREERPDVDAVYMAAVQAMTGHGGWPMSVFVTPEGVPFFGGTYWPKSDRAGMPGFLRVLEAVSTAWREQRDQVLDGGEQLAAHLRRQQQVDAGTADIDEDAAARAAAICVRAWDRHLGGFGGAPKFPQAMTIDFLLAHSARTGDEAALDAATSSLEAMARGGIHDQVGGGFHRYSVDERWLVPHFEKMLYDNALLLRAYVHASQATCALELRRVAESTAEYLLRDLRDPAGGFYSSTDADSEGQEGKFFVWSDEEFRAVVAGAGSDPDLFARYFGVTPEGNFHELPGANILHRPEPALDDDPQLAEALPRVRTALRHQRQRRVPPALDDKVLTSWNGLALGALAEAGAVLGEPRYVDAARACAAFLRERLVVDGVLHHSWRAGTATIPAFLEDVALLAQGLLALFEADGDPRWYAWARELADDAEARFADGDTGTYFATAHDAEALLTRPKDLWDNATPAGSSVMVDVHLRLGALSGDPHHQAIAERTLAAFLPRAEQAPTGYGELLRGLERLLAGPQEVAVVGDRDDPATVALAAVYREALRPGAVLAVGPSQPEPAVPLLAQRPLLEGRPAAYVCRNFACERPVATPDELRELLAA